MNQISTPVALAPHPPLNVHEFERLAQEVLPPMAWEYFALGAEDELTVADNQAAFRRIKMRPRMMVDVTQRDLSTEVLGQRLAFPLILGPTSHQRMAHPDAEIAVARAAARAGIIGVFGTGTHFRIDEIAAASGGPIWFQLYGYESREVTARMIQRAEQAGCKALVITADGNNRSWRERQIRIRFSLPPEVEIRNLVGVGLRDDLLDGTAAGMAAFIKTLRPLKITWDDLDWVRSVTHMPIIIKGIMTAEDALLAVEHGVEGIVVSNHGGRQLDCTLASIEALPEIADAVAGRIEILIDGGVRRGTDIVRAIALGAKAVLVARPYLWGLAVNGQQGVSDVIDLYRDQMDCAMAQMGRPTVADIDRSAVTIR